MPEYSPQLAKGAERINTDTDAIAEDSMHIRNPFSLAFFPLGASIRQHLPSPLTGEGAGGGDLPTPVRKDLSLPLSASGVGRQG